ncbi:hypothetical protein EVAR_101170_1 [Eumeta japonica]|uniref:Uncharacterized protein n=1 Tax=Eumeta variegata TaxID=151549 RepID=A0A4C2A9T4_EUMVA|nr:hypothetical protein EVAR_101170_1 [Eumeta japonica]
MAGTRRRRYGTGNASELGIFTQNTKLKILKLLEEGYGALLNEVNGVNTRDARTNQELMRARLGHGEIKRTKFRSARVDPQVGETGLCGELYSSLSYFIALGSQISSNGLENDNSGQGGCLHCGISIAPMRRRSAAPALPRQSPPEKLRCQSLDTHARRVAWRDTGRNSTTSDANKKKLARGTIGRNRAINSMCSAKLSVPRQDFKYGR